MIPRPTIEDSKRNAEQDYAIAENCQMVSAMWEYCPSELQQWIRLAVYYRERYESETKRANDNESQLVEIATYLGKDARHVVGDGEHSIATLVKQEFEILKKGRQ